MWGQKCGQNPTCRQMWENKMWTNPRMWENVGKQNVGKPQNVRNAGKCGKISKFGHIWENLDKPQTYIPHFPYTNCIPLSSITIINSETKSVRKLI